MQEFSHVYACMSKEKDMARVNIVICLPRLSSWALSSSCSFSQDDWETAVPAGDTCRPSHTYTNKRRVFSVCSVWQFWLAWVDNSQSRNICSPSFLAVHLFLHLLPVLCRTPAVWPGAFYLLSPKNLNDLPGLAIAPPLFPPCLSSFSGYFYSFVLRKQEQIMFWAHQHFQGPTAAEWEGRHGNPIAQLDTLLTPRSDW